MVTSTRHSTKQVDEKHAAKRTLEQNEATPRTHNDTKRHKNDWNDMSHLKLKRFSHDDPTLTDGTKRDRAKHDFVVCAELDPSGRSKCKLCGTMIHKGSLRFCLMLECHKGYRNACTLHEACFWKHPETIKLDSVDEIVMKPNVNEKAIKERFEKFQAEKDVSKVE